MDERAVSGGQSWSDSPEAHATDGSGRVSFLEQALWQRLGGADDLAAYAEAWLALQCQMIPEVRRGVVVSGAGQSGFAPVARWPEEAQPSRALMGAAESALGENRGVLQGRSPDGSVGACLAHPIVLDDTVRGVVALELELGARIGMRAAMRQLQWGLSGLRDWLRRELMHAQRDTVDQVSAVLDLTAAALEEESFQGACRAAVTELALHLGCERVSIGFIKRGRCAVTAISHTAQFGKQMQLVRLLGAAMDEAIDQQAVIVHPQAETFETHVTRAHGDLIHEEGTGQIVTAPLFAHDHFVGAITFERAEGEPFDQRTVELLETVAGILAPVLKDKKDNDRWVAVKVVDTALAQLRRLLGPGYFGRKLALLGTAAVVAIFYFATAPYRISADAALEGLVQRSIVAPFQGFIEQAEARAGDTVAKDAVLATLDERELSLQRLRWVTERQKLVHEYERALSERNRAETKIIQARIEQAEAEIRLLEQKLARAAIRAPFDGLVVSGDLSQQIGGAVNRGDVLFEVAPLDSYRVILQVDEGQISEVEPGQEGELLVSSLPDLTFPFVIDKITPVAQAIEGRNVFRVEARLAENSARLRPGMEGVGKIDVDERRLIWIWTRSFVNWLKVWAWRWQP